MKGIIKFLNEVKLELVKVVWPKKDAVIRLTIVVLIISGIVGLYLGALDFIFTNTLSAILAL